MSHRPIMDAGPGINFFSVNKERLLFEALGPLCVPEVVKTEILRKARQDQRFAAAEKVWKKLPERLMTVISDDVTAELAWLFREFAVPQLNSVCISEETWAKRWLSPTRPWQLKPGKILSSSSTTVMVAVLLRVKLDDFYDCERMARRSEASD